MPECFCGSAKTQTTPSVRQKRLVNLPRWHAPALPSNWSVDGGPVSPQADGEGLFLEEIVMAQKKAVILCLAVLFGLNFFLFLLEQAEARRFGGGKSFGSRPSYQRSAPQPQRSAPSQNQGTQPGQAAPAAAPRPWGGMLGGLLMGGLIGSLLFGGGFTGPGLVDILVFGGLAFMLIRFLRSRRMAAEGYQSAQLEMPSGGMAQERAWTPSALGTGNVSAGETGIPAGFDQEDFLKGAKAMYARLQDAWNRRDLEDIRQFTSPEVWQEINRQAEEDPTSSRTDILLVNARLLEVKNVDGRTVGSVHYDVLLRENSGKDEPTQVQEVWHFSQEESTPGSFWILEGIQQVEP